MPLFDFVELVGLLKCLRCFLCTFFEVFLWVLLVYILFLLLIYAYLSLPIKKKKQEYLSLRRKSILYAQSNCISHMKKITQQGDENK